MILHFIFWGSEGSIQKERREINSEKGAQISIVTKENTKDKPRLWLLSPNMTFFKNFLVKYYVHIYVGDIKIVKWYLLVLLIF